MLSRIEKMHEVWRELEFIKRHRPRPQGVSPTEGLDKVRPPPFGNAVDPFVQQMPKRSVSSTAEVFSGKVILAESEPVECNEPASPRSVVPPMASTPPKMRTGGMATISSQSIELPELPTERAEDSMSEFQSSSAASSPRANEPGNAVVGSGVKKLRKRISKRLSRAADDLSVIAQKISPRSDIGSPRKALPIKDDPLLAGISLEDRSRIATEMATYCQSESYRNSGATRQALLFNGKLIGLLGTHPGMIRPDTLKALGKDLEQRMKNAVIDTKVKLDDPRFIKFVQSVAQANFMKPWTHDSADTADSATGVKKKNADVLRPTFVRDFDNSDYFFRDVNGTRSRINNTDDFMALIDGEEDSGLASVVSNIASQNLGNFLKNVLFLRHDSQGISQSVLREHDGTPIMPLAIAKAGYTFAKDEAGNITLDYEWNSSNEINGNKELRVKRMTGDTSSYTVQEATLKIAVRITIARNRQWNIGDPHIKASGWSLPSGQ